MWFVDRKNNEKPELAIGMVFLRLSEDEDSADFGVDFVARMNVTG